LQAALLVPQWARLDERNAVRWSNVKALCEALANVPGVRPFVETNEADLPAFYKLGLQFDDAVFGLERDRLIQALRAEGFALDEGFTASHRTRSPKRFRQGSTLTEAERASRGCVMLHHPVLLETPAAMSELAAAWQRIHHHRQSLKR
jgi:dTDP-4-amino-4,6-dideoxygalactose transaminase